jgi:hypothetical protein
VGGGAQVPMPIGSSKVLHGVRDSGTLVTGGTGSRCWGADVPGSRKIQYWIQVLGC